MKRESSSEFLIADYLRFIIWKKRM